MRGVTSVRGRLIPLLHLGALMGGADAPADAAPLMVVAESRGSWLGLEVDEADSASAAESLEGEQEGTLTDLSSGAIRRAGGWIPVLNLEAMARRWLEPATKA
jgi:chemotaxis signal transduction protein